MRKMHAIVAVVALLTNFAGAATAAEPYEINVILPMTGSGAFQGAAAKEDLDVITSLVNKSGGINGRPVKFTIADDESSPQVAVQLLTSLTANTVPVIIGPLLVATCEAVTPRVISNGPVTYCLNPAAHPKRGGYLFAASHRPVDSALALVRYFRSRGWTRLAMITSTDASGLELQRAFDTVFAMPENKDVHLLVAEHFNPSDVSVAAQMAHIKALNPQALITWTVGTPFGTLLRGIHDAGLTIPVGASTGDLNTTFLRQFTAFISTDLYFPGTRVLTRNGVPPGPLRDAQNRYFDALTAAGYVPDATHAIPWDPVMIVVDALRHVGTNATATQVRDYIDGMAGWVGVEEVYDFHDQEQRGVTVNGVVVDKWDPDKKMFVAVSKPGGFP